MPKHKTLKTTPATEKRHAKRLKGFVAQQQAAIDAGFKGKLARCGSARAQAFADFPTKLVVERGSGVPLPGW